MFNSVGLWQAILSRFSLRGQIEVGWYFVFFFISGFCSILYELIWLRLSMAQFGVNTALVSIVISMFMAGLGLGSWGSGKLLRAYESRIHWPALGLYGLTELLIGASAILVPFELSWGRTLLENMGSASSLRYYLVSALWVALTIVPWCACMGATIPLGMLAIRRTFPGESARSFSFLYLANVAGAIAGTFVPLWLVEVLGFRGALKVGVLLNGLLGASAITLSQRLSEADEEFAAPAAWPQAPVGVGSWSPLLLLFLAGLTSMGLEVVWIRQFTPYEGTVVYAFALILVVYLVGTFIGSRLYRRWDTKVAPERRLLWMLLGLTAVLSPVAAGATVALPPALRLLVGIAPFTGLLGFVTPMLVDGWSGGDPAKAGDAYAVNVAGCIVGPLLSAFVLLPLTSERWVQLVLASPWIVLGLYPRCLRTPGQVAAKLPSRWVCYGLLSAAFGLVIIGKGYDERYPARQVLRDHTATVVAEGTGMNKQLLINGIGITFLSPITKMMAHLPLSMLDRAPSKALVICFGMGTTYRSLMSWGIQVTAVELVPSVPKLFAYYHPDGPKLLESPRSTLVIDDGRRYLERTQEQYDVIAIDPPPPVEAAGSSLLYSREFYALAQRRLRPDGILQQWLPYGDPVIVASVAKALKESFPEARVFRSIEGWGYHFLVSRKQIPSSTAAELVAHMPAQAVADLMEWGPKASAYMEFAAVLHTELKIDELIGKAAQAPTLQDDRPVNEYYMLRRKLVGNRLRPGEHSF